MTTLRVILDQLTAPVPGGIGRYTEELTRGLITTAPKGCEVVGTVPSSPEPVYDSIFERLPGLAGLEKSAFGRRELALAWQLGAASIPSGAMMHAPSLMAPLRRHDRLNRGTQIAVTVHDAVPWTHPETLTPRGAAWHRAMAERARRYADAIVVPTHAVAAQLAEHIDFGDRVRVIGGAASSALHLADDHEERAERLGLPERYVAAVGTVEPRKGLDWLIDAMSTDAAPDLPLVVVGPPGWGGVDLAALAASAGLAPERLMVLGRLDDADLATVLHRATMFAFPSRAEGFGLPVLEAMALGTPVVHTDLPAVMEVAADAGLVVDIESGADVPRRLAEQLRRIAEDAELAEQLAVRGLDRARAFSWRDSAEKVWQLHADL